MTELLRSAIDTETFEGRFPTKGNIPIGFFRAEKVTLIDDTIIPLKGPPIAVYHPPEYDTAEYRANNGGETMTNGIIGIYNIDAEGWITSTIQWVDKNRTTIITTGDDASEGHDVMVYYYAESPGIGVGTSVLPGDIVTPDSIDILIKALNDAVPMIFTEYGSSGDGSPEFRFGADAYHNTGVRATVEDPPEWTTLIDSSVPTGSARWADYPVYMTELVVKSDSNGNAWSYIDFRITVDGTVVTNGFNDVETDYIRWLSLDPEDFPSGASYDRHPGKMFGADNEPLFFDVYYDPFGTYDRWVWRFGLNMEITSSIKVEARPTTTFMDNIDTYVRGWYIPS